MKKNKCLSFPRRRGSILASSKGTPLKIDSRLRGNDRVWVLRILTKKIIPLLLLSFTFGCSTAMAQVMLAQPMSVILQKLKGEGYIAVQKAELNEDKNEFEILALDNEGEPSEIRINSHSAEIIEIKKTDSHIDMLEIVDKIEGVGYSGISRIEVKNGIFEIDAIGRDGKEIHLSINAVSGVITKV